jgi:hypothetical protein
MAQSALIADVYPIRGEASTGIGIPKKINYL